MVIKLWPVKYLVNGKLLIFKRHEVTENTKKSVVTSYLDIYISHIMKVQSRD